MIKIINLIFINISRYLLKQKDSIIKFKNNYLQSTSIILFKYITIKSEKKCQKTKKLFEYFKNKTNILVEKCSKSFIQLFRSNSNKSNLFHYLTETVTECF